MSSSPKTLTSSSPTMPDRLLLSPSIHLDDDDDSSSSSSHSSDNMVQRRMTKPPSASQSFLVNRSPISTIHAIHPQMVMNKLKPIKDDFLNYVESMGASISQLSFSVNDSAGGKTFDQCYEKLDELGEGGFAVVYRCRHKERGHTYAVKEVFYAMYEEGETENLKEEIDAMKRLRDVPCIVRLLDVFEEVDKSLLIMEKMEGGDLLGRICDKVTYSEPDARKVSRRLLEALYYCHKKHIVHRDVKPENILLPSAENDTLIKLADFGCAKRFQPGVENPLFTLCGSPQYVAPEVYAKDGYDERCDLWSAAVVIYVLLGGYAPFDGEDYELPSKIKSGKYQFHKKYWKSISKPPKDLIKSLLNIDPHRRATIEQALDSEWLRRRDKDQLSTCIEKSGDMSLSNFDAWCQNKSVSNHGNNESSQSITFAVDE